MEKPVFKCADCGRLVAWLDAWGLCCDCVDTCGGTADSVLTRGRSAGECGQGTCAEMEETWRTVTDR
jgi:hypothetical protein